MALNWSRQACHCVADLLNCKHFNQVSFFLISRPILAEFANVQELKGQQISQKLLFLWSLLLLLLLFRESLCQSLYHHNLWSFYHLSTATPNFLTLFIASHFCCLSTMCSSTTVNHRARKNRHSRRHGRKVSFSRVSQPFRLSQLGDRAPPVIEDCFDLSQKPVLHHSPGIELDAVIRSSGMRYLRITSKKVMLIAVYR